MADVDIGGLIATMRSAGERAYPREACGLVVAAGKKSLAVECLNISPESRDRFMIDPRDYAKAADMGEIIGVWHTHPNLPPTPSPADKVGCENSGVTWYILGIHKEGGEFVYSGPSVTEPSGFEMPLEGRPYVMGVLDCYTILQDFYKREYGLEVTDYPRIEEDGRMGFTRFVERYADEGFVRLIDQPAQRGDVFLIQMGGHDGPSHIAVYLGDDMILHHCHDRLSRKDIYGGGYWYRHTTHHLRHKTQC